MGGAATLLALSSCAGGDHSSESSATTPPEIPEALLGTYTMSLTASDLPPSPAPELTDHAEHWTMKITTSGAPAGGPAPGASAGPILRTHRVTLPGVDPG